MALEILNIPPGTLNEFDVDDMDFNSINFQGESNESIMQRIRDKVFNQNKFKTSGTLIGILLRDEKIAGSGCTPLDFTTSTTKAGNAKYALNKYRIRIPELHFMLKVPNKIKNPSAKDKLIIDSYPLIQAIDTYVQKDGAVPGDLVKVEMSNKGGMTRLYYTGALDPHRVGAGQDRWRKCMERCRKNYKGAAATGDCHSRKINPKSNDGIPPVVAEPGTISDDVIHADGGADWLANKLRGDLKDSFPGVKWVGGIDGNGEGDSGVHEHAKGKTTGRTTFIYIPQGTVVTKDVEVVYYFHDNRGFSPSFNWREMGNSFKKMSEQKPGGKGTRNVVFVIPEMMWSSGKNATARIGTKKKPKTLSGPCYADRHWATWGFDGKLKIQGATAKKPLSYEGNTLAENVHGNIDSFYTNVNKVLKDELGLKKVEFESLVGDRMGGVAISNLARMNKLNVFKKLYRIQMLNSDNSATVAHDVSSADVWTNQWHDNDIKDLMGCIVGLPAKQKPRLEVHMSIHSKEDKADPKHKLPFDALCSFIGASSRVIVDAVSSGKNLDAYLDKDAVKDLWDRYKKGPPSGLLWAGSTKTKAKMKPEFQIDNSEGYGFLQSNIGKTLVLSGPWQGVLYKGWPTQPTNTWLGPWVEYLPETVPTIVSVGEMMGITPGVTNETDDKNLDKPFKGFKGETIIYKTAKAGSGLGNARVAIIKPTGADVMQPLELIYFFHGNKGNWQSAWKLKQVKTALNAMALPKPGGQNRNVVLVVMDTNPKSGQSNADSTWGSKGIGGKFVDFHKEVKLKIKQHWKSEPNIDFISLKSFSGGYRQINNIFTSLGTTAQVDGNTIRRVDLLDSVYEDAPPAFVKMAELAKAKAIEPGVNFEVNAFYATTAVKTKIDKYTMTTSNGNGFNGYKKIGPFKDLADGFAGLHVEKAGSGHTDPLKQKFGAEQKVALKPPSLNYTPKLLKGPGGGPKVDLKQVPVAYDESGNAINASGEVLPQKYALPMPDVVCRRDKKKHVAKIDPAKREAFCKTKCKRYASTSSHGGTGGTGEQDCGTNPLGLSNYGPKADFSKSLKLSRGRNWKANKQWGMDAMGTFITKCLEDDVWTKASSSPAGYSGRYWSWGDISAENANGIDRLGTHGSHKEGYDMDLSMAIKSKGTVNGPAVMAKGTWPNVKAGPSATGSHILDIDKVIALAILAWEHVPSFRRKGSGFIVGKEGHNSGDVWDHPFHIMERISAIVRHLRSPTTVAKPSDWDDAYRDLFQKLVTNSDLQKRMLQRFGGGGIWMNDGGNHSNHIHVRLHPKRSATQMKRVLTKQPTPCQYYGPGDVRKI